MRISLCCEGFLLKRFGSWMVKKNNNVGELMVLVGGFGIVFLPQAPSTTSTKLCCNK